ncbi:hypothetical protein [Altericista sp. CCNU0014]
MPQAPSGWIGLDPKVPSLSGKTIGKPQTAKSLDAKYENNRAVLTGYWAD